MYSSTNAKNQFNNPAYNRRYRYSKNEPFNRDFNRNENLSAIKFNETKSGYHFELKIPGYVKDDFYFYLRGNELVVTTERSKKTQVNDMETNKVQRHSYCYPSAFFKRTIDVPDDIVRDEIFFDYQNEVLKFDLTKAIFF